MKRYSVIGFGAAYVLLVPTVYVFRRKIRGWLSKILRRYNDFDIILDHFPRVFQLHPIPHAP